MPATSSDGVTAYWTTPAEVKARTFTDWLSAHTSFCAPLHHWKGRLALTQDALLLSGTHKRTGLAAEYRVAPNELEEVHLGFDDVFTRREERSLGITFVPLRLRFRQGGQQHTLYLALGFRRAFRTSDNKQWAERLEGWRQRGPGAEGSEGAGQLTVKDQGKEGKAA